MDLPAMTYLVHVEELNEEDWGNVDGLGAAWVLGFLSDIENEIIRLVSREMLPPGRELTKCVLRPRIPNDHRLVVFGTFDGTRDGCAQKAEVTFKADLDINTSACRAVDACIAQLGLSL